MIYIYNALSILTVGLLFKKYLYNDKNKKKFLAFAFIQMFIIQALRSSNVGTDTLYYVTVYDNFQNFEYYSFLFTHFEVGFKWLILMLKHFNLDAQWLLITASAITMYGFAHFIYKNTENPFISPFIFACMFYPNSFNIVRQYLAISIAINSFQFVRDRKYIKSAAIIFVACLFHVTAILMVIPMLLQMVKNWKAVRKLIIASMAVFFVFGNKIVIFLLSFLGKTFYLTGFEVNRIFRMTTALTIVFAILIWYLSGKVKDKKVKPLFNLLSCIAFVNMVFGILYLKYEFFSRVIEIMNLYLLISIPYGMKYARFKSKKILEMGYFVLPLLLMLNSIYNSGSGISEYTMFFQ